MKPPVEHVRVSTKGKDMLKKVKRKTGLEHWNEICRIAFCRSISNPNPVKLGKKFGEISSVDMEWKTFARPYEDIYSAITYVRASEDGIDLKDKEAVADYFRAHLERGIATFYNVKGLEDLIPISSETGTVSLQNMP